jgi:hypothetical protein
MPSRTHNPRVLDRGARRRLARPGPNPIQYRQATPLFMPHTDHKQEASRATDHHTSASLWHLACLPFSPPACSAAKRWRISRSQLP